MNFTLTRPQKDYLPTGVFGIMDAEDESCSFVTAEHSYPLADGIEGYYAKILPGTYTCKRRHSPEFGYDVFWVTDVPNCEWIEIHIGNWPQKDSDGCILLGLFNSGNTSVMHSKNAFDLFMAKQQGVNEFTLTVI